MRVPNESIAGLVEKTSLPDVWLRQWTTGRDADDAGQRARMRAGLPGLINKVNLAALPLPGGRRRPAAEIELALSA